VDDPNCVKTYLQPTNAVASTEEDAAKKAEFVKDGDMKTRWSSVYKDGEWIYVDLGSAQKLNRVELHFEAAFTKHYQIQGSNNVEADQWFFLAEVEDGNGGKDIVNFEPREARYVRMYAVKRGSVWGNSLWEFQPYFVDCSLGQGGAGGQGAGGQGLGGQGGAGGVVGASGSAGHPSG
jgi:chondroitin AC lyase